MMFADIIAVICITVMLITIGHYLNLLRSVRELRIWMSEGLTRGTLQTLRSSKQEGETSCGFLVSSGTIRTNLQTATVASADLGSDIGCAGTSMLYYSRS